MDLRSLWSSINPSGNMALIWTSYLINVRCFDILPKVTINWLWFYRFQKICFFFHLYHCHINLGGDGGNGSMTIIPKVVFDRESDPGKVLEIPLVLTDKQGRANHASVHVIIGDQVGTLCTFLHLFAWELLEWITTPGRLASKPPLILNPRRHAGDGYHCMLLCVLLEGPFVRARIWRWVFPWNFLSAFIFILCHECKTFGISNY